MNRRSYVRSLAGFSASTILPNTEYVESVQPSQSNKNPALYEENWTKPYYDEKNSSYNPHGIEITDEDIVDSFWWKEAQAGGANISTQGLVSYGGSIYVPTGGEIYKYNSRSGEVQASWGGAETYADSVAIGSGTLVYPRGQVETQEAKIVASSPPLEEPTWQFEDPFLLSISNINVCDESVIFGGYNNRPHSATAGDFEKADTPGIYSVNIKTGELNWKYNIAEEPAYEGPVTDIYPAAYSNGKIFVVESSGVIHSIDANDGTEIWLNDNCPNSIPVVAEDGVLLADDKLVKYNKQTGELIWEAEFGATNSFVLKDGEAYLPGKTLQKVDVHGELVWERTFTGDGNNPIVWGYCSGAGEVLYAAGVVNETDPSSYFLGAIDTESGDLHWIREIDYYPITSPMTTPYGLYVLTTESAGNTPVYAFGPDSTKPDFHLSPENPDIGEEVTVKVSGKGLQNVTIEINDERVDLNKNIPHYQYSFQVSQGQYNVNAKADHLFGDVYRKEWNLEVSSADPSTEDGTQEIVPSEEDNSQVAEDVPGLGIPSALIGLGSAGYLINRHSNDSD